MTDRERFEQAYGEDNEMTAAQVLAQRLSNGSYRLPKMASAWYWWKRSKEKSEATGGSSGALDSVVSTDKGRSVLQSSGAPLERGLA